MAVRTNNVGPVGPTRRPGSRASWAACGRASQRVPTSETGHKLRVFVSGRSTEFERQLKHYYWEGVIAWKLLIEITVYLYE